MHTETGKVSCKAKYEQSISVFFPCYNEASIMPNLVKQCISVLEKLFDDYEIIIVDDGSIDGTGPAADKLARQFQSVKVIHHSKNKGYGAALQSGFKAATKKLVFYTDGDSQFEIGDIEKLLSLIDKNDIVSAYRLNRSEGFIRKFNAWAWGRLVCMLFEMNIKDIDCGFKLYKREIFDNIRLRSTGALIDAEVLAKALHKGYSIAQIGVRHYPRLAGSSSGANISVILRAFKELLKLRKDILRK